TPVRSRRAAIAAASSLTVRETTTRDGALRKSAAAALARNATTRSSEALRRFETWPRGRRPKLPYRRQSGRGHCSWLDRGERPPGQRGGPNRLCEPAPCPPPPQRT